MGQMSSRVAAFSEKKERDILKITAIARDMKAVQCKNAFKIPSCIYR